MQWAEFGLGHDVPSWKAFQLWFIENGVECRLFARAGAERPTTPLAIAVSEC